MGNLVTNLVFRPPKPGKPFADEYFVNLPDIGVCIPVLYLRTERATARATTLLLAHGNGEDLSSLELFARHLVVQLGVNVAAFEYPGYGRSIWLDKNETKPLLPSEAFVYAAAEGAFQWLQTVQKIPSADIVFLGRSLGSGAAVHLAVHCALQNVRCGGLILLSPIASAVRVVLPRICITVPLVDMFANVDKIALINCRATVIHGTRDEVVPIQCAWHLNAVIPDAHRSAPLYIEGGGHNNLLARGNAVLDHINTFLAHLAAETDVV